MALDTKILLTIQATLTTAADLLTTTSPLAYPITHHWDSGTGADQADLFWTDTRTIAASGTDDLDLNGSLTFLGSNVNFARIRLLAITADPTNTNNLTVGNATTNAWGGGTTPFGGATTTTRVVPGATHLYIADSATGMAVTAGSVDTLRIANSGGGTTVTYSIILIGCSL